MNRVVHQYYRRIEKINAQIAAMRAQHADLKARLDEAEATLARCYDPSRVVFTVEPSAKWVN